MKAKVSNTNTNKIEMGATLYDINKQLVIQTENALSENELQSKIDEIEESFYSTQDTYFMLLNKELSDYTVFHTKDNNRRFQVLSGLKECLLNRGKVLSIEKLPEGNDCYEIWILKEKEAFMYLLFPYTEGVIE